MASENKSIQVATIWNNDSGDASIILLKSTDPKRQLQTDLFWYSQDAIPSWRVGDMLTDDQVLTSKYYKYRKFTSIEQDIPDDCYMSLV
jgi:hypothetical protein